MILRRLFAGLAAGAAGTTALNAVTYLDMVARARPSSSTPEETVRVVERATGVVLSQDGPASDAAANRRSGLGALMGIAAGAAVGVAYGLLAQRLVRVPAVLRGVLVGVAANVATTGPMAAAGITDVREWTASSWISDIVPHLGYGFATVAVADPLVRSRVR